MPLQTLKNQFCLGLCRILCTRRHFYWTSLSSSWPQITMRFISVVKLFVIKGNSSLPLKFVTPSWYAEFPLSVSCNFSKCIFELWKSWHQKIYGKSNWKNKAHKHCICHEFHIEVVNKKNQNKIKTVLDNIIYKGNNTYYFLSVFVHW